MIFLNAWFTVADEVLVGLRSINKGSTDSNVWPCDLSDLYPNIFFNIFYFQF